MNQLLWHYDVHARLARSRLAFWRLQFLPTYLESVAQRVRDVLEASGVRSFAIYETFGSYDLLVRCWIPATLSVDELDSALHADLRGSDLHYTDFFEVNEEIRHWCWAHGDAPIGIDAEQPREMQERLSNVTTDMALYENGLGQIDDLEHLSQAIADNWVRPIEPSPGIRFFVVLTPPIGSMIMPARSSLRSEIQNHAEAAGHDGLEDISIYAGHGFGELMILARAPEDRFYDLVRRFVNGIGSNSLVLGFRMRTFTAVSAETNFVGFTDQLALADPESGEPSLLELISQEESRRLEFKATAFADLSHYVADEPRSDLRPLPKLLEKITATVCALLNSEEGGSIVIGAMEYERFISDNEGRARKNGIRESVQDTVDREFGTPVSRTKICISGIEWDLKLLGQSWDEYSRHLQSKIFSKIAPHPAPWFTIRRVEHGPESSVAIISVRPMSRGWAYVQDKDPGASKTRHRFHVREDASTEEYTGPDADNYKQSSLRPA